MNPFEMVIVIVLIVFGAGAFKFYLQYKEKLSKNQSAADTIDLETKLANQEKIIQSMKTRIETLESIVIRDEYELDRKFKEL